MADIFDQLQPESEEKRTEVPRQYQALYDLEIDSDTYNKSMESLVLSAFTFEDMSGPGPVPKVYYCVLYEN
jgi:hypothetical protein